MGTGCRIAIVFGPSAENQTFRSIHIHFDGYLENGVGEELLKSYNTIEKVIELIEGGDRISIFDKYDSYIKFIDDHDIVSFYKKVIDASDEYYYIFRNDTWYCGDTYSQTPISNKVVKLEEAIKIMKEYNEINE
jgi:hypothetical protein